MSYSATGHRHSGYRCHPLSFLGKEKVTAGDTNKLAIFLLSHLHPYQTLKILQMGTSTCHGHGQEKKKKKKKKKKKILQIHNRLPIWYLMFMASFLNRSKQTRISRHLEKASYINGIKQTLQWNRGIRGNIGSIKRKLQKYN